MKRLIITCLILTLCGCMTSYQPPIKPLTPKNIALLLPLHGTLGPSSEAIRNGFLTAHNSQNPAQLTLKIVDTTEGNFITHYNQAIANGAELIVGPLTKPDVANLAQLHSLPVPTIALNTSDHIKNPPHNLYQFGLIPQDEIRQVAAKLSTLHERIAIIAPNTTWSNNLIQIFTANYQGHVVQKMFFTDQASLATRICQLVAANPETLCVKQQKPEPAPKRRPDIDAIFLLANASEARQIIPLLKFYYAGDLPVYAMSTIYNGIPQPSLDQDLEGIIFCDMPWILRSSLNLDLQIMHQQITTLWPESFTKYNRLYALGIDAYYLATSLPQALNAAGLTASGVLTLDSTNHIHRHLSWARIRQGIPELVREF